MKTLLTFTTSIVAASLVTGISTSANAQDEGADLILSGDITLGWTGFSSDEGNASNFKQDVNNQTGSFDFSFDLSGDISEYDLRVFAYADMSAKAIDTDFGSMDVMLRSAAIGASGQEGALLARVGARETSYAYASDLAVGGAGISTHFHDEVYGSAQPFNSIELIYAHAQGPLSFSGAFEPETGKMSGAVGYDFATSYGPARVNGYAFEDPMSNMVEDIDAIRGYRGAAFVDNGELEIGGHIAVEDLDIAASKSKIERLSYAVGGKLAIQADINVSADFENGEIKENNTSFNYSAFSLGAEWSASEWLSMGAHIKQYDDRPSYNWSDTDSDGDADFATGRLSTGNELGVNVSVKF